MTVSRAYILSGLIITVLAVAAVTASKLASDVSLRSIVSGANSAGDGEADRWLWVRQGGGDGWTYGTGIAVSTGGVFASGFMNSNARFEDTQLRVRGRRNGIVVRYARGGDVDWITQVGESGDITISAIALDVRETSRPWVLGTIKRPDYADEEAVAHFSRSLLQRAGADTDAWFGTLDYLTGEPVCAHQFHGTGIEPPSLPTIWPYGIQPSSLVFSPDGALFAAGYFSGSLTEAGPTGHPEGSGFIVRIDNHGEINWMHAVGGADNRIEALAATPDGDVYAVGHFTGEAVFGENVVRSVRVDSRDGEDFTAAADFFVAKYSSSGDLLWVRSGRSAAGDPDAPPGSIVVRGRDRGSSLGYAAAVRPEGGVVVGGGFEGRIDFAGSSHYSMPSHPPLDERLSDAFVAAFDEDGNELWMATGGGPAGEGHNSVAIGPDGSVYATGSFMYRARFGDLELHAPGEPGEFAPRLVYVVKYDSEGREQWATQSYAEGGLSAGNAIAVSHDSICYLTGFFDGRATFGRHRLRGFRSRNMFVAALNCAD